MNVRVILAAAYGDKRSHHGNSSPPDSPSTTPMILDHPAQVMIAHESCIVCFGDPERLTM